MQDTTTPAHQPVGPMDDAGRSVAADVAFSALAMLGCYAVEVYLSDEWSGTYVCAAALAAESTFTMGPPLPQEAIAAVAPAGNSLATFEAAGAIDGPLGDEARRLGAPALLVMRCDRGHRALGTVVCAFEDARMFGDDFERRAAAFARLAAVSLDYARRTNAALDRADRLATLLDSASAFAGELDLETLFAAIHDQVRRHMDAPAFIVALENSESGQLRTEYVVDSGVRLHVDAVPPEGGIAHDVFVSGRPIVLESASALPEGTALTFARTGRRTESVLFVPMRLRDQVIGTLNLFRTAPNGLDQAAARAARALVDVATIGVLQERAVRQQELVAEQLQAALQSRVMIEQAKGILAERNRVTPDQAFLVLRHYARNHNRPLTALAADVIHGTADIAKSSSQAGTRQPPQGQAGRPARPEPPPGPPS